MKALVRSCLVLGFAVTAGLFTVATAAGAVRLLPWLFAPQVPLSVSLPFGHALLARALETALIIGAPVGFAVAGAQFVERGEARALHALGVTPGSLVLRLSIPAAALCAAYLLSGPSRYDSPGRFAADLLSQGRKSCQGARDARAVEIPLVGVTWLCFPGRPPVAAGRVPGLASAAWFTAGSIEPSNDLRRFELRDLRLLVARETRGLSLRADAATIDGLPSWGRPETLGSSARIVLTVLGSFALALVSAFTVIASGIASRLFSCISAGSSALVTVALVSALDRAKTIDMPLAYALCPAAGVAVSLILARLARELRDRGRLAWAFSEPSLLGGREDDRKRPASRRPHRRE